MSQQNNNPASAAPSAAPAPTVQTPAPAPSAAPASANEPKPNTLEYYDRMASLSLQANSQAPAEPPPAAPAAAPAVPGQEPAPATPETPAVQPSGQQPDDGGEIHEPSAEELAVLNEPGQRALKAEREKRKAARTENEALKAKVAELEGKLAVQPQAQPQTPPAQTPDPNSPQPPNNPTQPTTTPSVATPALQDCTTFEQVEARALSAAQTKVTVMGLQTQLQRQGHEAVAAQLGQMGVTQIGNTPIAEATPELIGDFLQSAVNGADLTQAQVAPRRRWIAEQNQSFKAAAKVLPGIGDPKSDVAKGVAAIIDRHPQIMQLSNWPQLAAELYMGKREFSKLATPAAPAPAVPPKPPVIKPAAETVPAAQPQPTRQAPGASPISGAAIPTKNRQQELSEKMANGTATMKEVDEYGALSIRV